MKHDDVLGIVFMGPLLLCFWMGALWVCAYLVHQIMKIFKCECWRWK